MKAKILRMIDKSMHKDPTCVICGEAKRKNKSLFEVELPCCYAAEVRICRTCSGEEGAMRHDAIELPYMDPVHYHLKDHRSKTFWDYIDTLQWIKEFIQCPAPIDRGNGIHVLRIPETEFTIIRCDGLPRNATTR
jgi:hypothetical protein